ncbi:MAG TPA: hypothetical protein VGF38_23290 [Ktedonobacterales bacterium]|jgi:hypothetical protein
MTFGYEYTFLLLAGLALIVYHVARHLRPTRQNTRSLQALIAWLVVPVAFVGVLTYIVFDSTPGHLGQLDSDNVGTIIVTALTLFGCVGAWREVELVILERRQIATG